LKAARASVGALDAPAHELRRRARLSYELAQRVLDPTEPLRAGSGVPLAAELFRESAYWSLCARHHGGQPVSPSQLWTAELEADLASDFDTRDTLQAARSLLCEASFVTLAELSQEQQWRVALVGRHLAGVALRKLDGGERLVDTLLWQRIIRVALCTLFMIAIVTGATVALQRRLQGPDLAVGKPWRTSSTWSQCDPATGRCGGPGLRIFFHTNEDASPWIEYDLGARVEFSRVTVQNRTDSSPDRAIPLIIEASDDQKTYRELARRVDTFSTWTADFRPHRARYVRLRVPRRSTLHLERVSIYRRE
jgi:hypothetical protein